MELKKRIDLLNVDSEVLSLYETMRHLGWNTKGFSLDSDVYNQPQTVKDTIFRSLSYLIFLDTLQVDTLRYISNYVGNDNGALTLALSEHQAQESLHVFSYNYILSVYPEELRTKIYTAVEDDKLLNQRAKKIAKPYNDFIENPNKETFVLALFADFLLEGFLFFNGFMPFYQLIEYFPNTQTIISLIHRDENIHVNLFQTLLKRLLSTDKTISRQQLIDYLYDLLPYEKEFNLALLGEHLPEDKIINHCDYLVNLRLANLGLKKYDKTIKNPLKRLYDIANFKENMGAKSNVMEIKSSSYAVTIDGLDEL